MNGRKVRVHPHAPVLGLDIDGTLAAYHRHFTWFAGLYLQRELTPEWREEYQGEFSLALGLDKAEYRQIKLAYRQGGMKRSIPGLDNYGDHIQKFVQGMRRGGCQVWICTTRPWNRLDNIDPDTQFWLERNVGRVDGVIYGEEKYEDLIDIVGQDRIIGVVDDLPENVERANALGLPSLLRSGAHNEWWPRVHQGKDRDQRDARTTPEVARWAEAQFFDYAKSHMDMEGS